MRAIVLFAVAVFVSGCGTLRNVSMRPASIPQKRSSARNIVYGGVKDDIARVRGAVEDLRRIPASNNGVAANLGSATAHVVDAPMSMIGDTLTLPVTIPSAIDRYVADYYLLDVVCPTGTEIADAED